MKTSKLLLLFISALVFCLAVIVIILYNFSIIREPYQVHEPGYEVTGTDVLYWMCGKEGCISSEINEADPASFVIIDEMYGKDNTYVYRHQVIVSEADINTFERISFSYSKDKKSAYYNGKKIENSDGETFALLRGTPEDDAYAKDQNTIYYRGVEIQNADLSTFTLFIVPSYAKDAFAVYYDGEKITGADPNSFELLDGASYAKDKDAVFFEGVKVESADVNSFELLEHPYAQDQNFIYRSGEKVEKR